jgi:hypothetical protein
MNGTKDMPKASGSALVAATNQATAFATDPTAVGTTETPAVAKIAVTNSAPEPARNAAAATATAEPAAAAPTVLSPGQQAPKVEPAWKAAPVAKPEGPKTEKAAIATADKTERLDKPAPPSPPAAQAAPAAAPAGGGSGDFDRAAALSTLSATATASQGCKKPDGPTGAGRVAVTYANNGSATTAVIEGPPFAGTAVGGCIAARFRATHIPSFGGSPVTVHKSFNIN